MVQNINKNNVSSKTKKQIIGQKGEDEAVRYLKDKGFDILDRNYRQPWGELDIIARSPDKILVIVEVKTVQGPMPEIAAEEQVTRAKLIKLRRTAELYANGPGAKFLTDKGWRIDLLAIVIEEEAAVKHYKNI